MYYFLGPSTDFSATEDWNSAVGVNDKRAYVAKTWSFRQPASAPPAGKWTQESNFEKRLSEYQLDSAIVINGK